MKKLLLIVIASAALLTMTPDTVEARWHFGFSAFYDNCDCYWGEPDPWDAWWDCPCYWDVWEWCFVHPYWMWPSWCRVYVQSYYSPCGRYYYVYYDYQVPQSRRVYVNGRYRYRYEVPLGSTYSITERIPRRSGLERSAGGGQPMPEPVSRTIASLGPEYRVKTVAAHAEPTSLRPGQQTQISTTTRERPSTDGAITPTNTTIPVRGETTAPARKTTELPSRDARSIPISTNKETGAVTIERKTTVESAVKNETSVGKITEETKILSVLPKTAKNSSIKSEPEKKERIESKEQARPAVTKAAESRVQERPGASSKSSATATSRPSGTSSKSIRNK